MPEMTFTVRWPDGAVVDCYSPSLVMHDHLDEGASYAVADFVSRSVEALDTASARVQAKYGFACTSAMAQRQDIERMAAGYPTGDVTVLRMHPALPGSDAAAAGDAGPAAVTGPAVTAPSSAGVRS